MADSRQPEDTVPQWDPSGGQEPGGPLGANGYPSSVYRTTAPYSTRENGFNGELTGAQAVTAVSARIVQEVTAEAVAVLKGEQETQRLPSVEDTTNLPPSPPPSPAAEHFGPAEKGRLRVKRTKIFKTSLCLSFFFSLMDTLRFQCAGMNWHLPNPTTLY
uniref:Microtubule-associated protein 2 n=1 Tax=Oryzias melastigma TaxID=30732 RepID=A0A3B3CVR4_ORYME